jgi:hypothetical protein
MIEYFSDDNSLSAVVFKASWPVAVGIYTLDASAFPIRIHEKLIMYVNHRGLDAAETWAKEQIACPLWTRLKA